MKQAALAIAILGPLLGSTVPALAAPPSVARAADSAPRVANLQVSVWPEYDDPRVLVMYQGTFAPGASFPQDVRFRVPKGAEITQTCALQEPGGEHLCQLSETKADGDWTLVSYNLPLPDFLVEFYYSPVTGAGQRNLDFSFSPTYAVDNLQLEVQQPLRSTAFDVNPATVDISSDQQGFKYYHYSFQDIPTDSPVGVRVIYSKPDANPSVAKQAQNSAAANSQDATRTIWIIIAVAMVVAVGLILVRQHRRGGAVAVAPNPIAKTARADRQFARSAAAERPQPGYCTQCGGSLRLGGRFCPSCGAAVRGTL